MKLIVPILFFFTFGCQSSIINDENFSIGEEFTLNFGQEKKLPNGELSVEFDSLLADSRCAIGVVCVWEGEAKIRLKLSFKETEDYEYHYLKIKGYVNRENTSQHESVVARYYIITLLQLDPYPVHNIPINVEKYKALLKIKYIER